MSKINFDKYYTNPDIVALCLQYLNEHNFPITEYLEPSAGNGSFLTQLPINTLAYDIEPEYPDIIKQDYLTLKIAYKTGRCVIGNPPFGFSNNLSLKFYNKSVNIGDYIAFIQPISQLNSSRSFYKFDLVSSHELPDIEYSGVKLHCCFNIWKRPLNRVLNVAPKNHPFRDIKLRTKNKTRNEKSITDDFCYSICSWGSVGVRPNYIGEYASEIYFYCYNKDLKTKLIEVCVNTDWKNIVPKSISTKTLNCWQIYDYLKTQIPELC